MSRYVAPLLITAFLLGCNANAQTNMNSSQRLYKDASEVYQVIIDTGLNSEYLNSDETELIENFNVTYIDNYEDYPNNDELITKMDQIIQNHKMYFVAVGMKDEEAIERYKKNYFEAVSYLDKKLK